MGANTVSSNVSVLDLICKDKYAEANNHKRARDELNKESKNWINTRNTNSERARDLSKKAAEAKAERDAYNEKVRELKVLRDQMHAKAAELRERVAERATRMPRPKATCTTTRWHRTLPKDSSHIS